MDIEEIKCALCSQVYNDNERMPILLPDCGHSFCYTCIQSCFEQLRAENQMISASLHRSPRKRVATPRTEINGNNTSYNSAEKGAMCPNGRKMSDGEDQHNPLHSDATIMIDEDDVMVEEDLFNEENHAHEALSETIIYDNLHRIDHESKPFVPNFVLFKCPEDDVECSIQNPDQLPKNFALLKIVQRTLASIADKEKNIMEIKFQQDENKFTIQKKEDKSLATFLSQKNSIPSPSQVPQQPLIQQIQTQQPQQLQQPQRLIKLSKPVPKAMQQTTTGQQQHQTVQFLRPKPQLVEEVKVPQIIQRPMSSNQQPIQISKPNYQSHVQPQQMLPGIDLCKQHSRPLELICVQDKQRVCAQCALFGEHRGHDVRQEEDVAKEISLKVEVLMEMYQAMHQQCLDLGSNQNYDRYYNIFKNRQNEVKVQIQEKFKEWRKQLRAVEMKIIDNLYINYGQFEDKFAQAMNSNKRMIADAQTWMEKAKNSLDEYTNKSKQDPMFIAYDMLDNNHADDILNQGDQILEKNDKQRGYPSLNGMEHQYNQVKVVFEPCFDKRLTNLAQVIGFGHSEHSGDFTTASQSFLPQLSFTNEEEINHNPMLPGALNISNISFNEPSSPINDKQNMNGHSSNATCNLDQDSKHMVEDVKLAIMKHNASNDSVNSSEGNIPVQQAQIRKSSLAIPQSQLLAQSQDLNNSNGAGGNGNLKNLATGSLRRVSMMKPSQPQLLQQMQQQQQLPAQQNPQLQTIETSGLPPKGPAQLTQSQLPKKKTDLATIFKTQATSSGELDLSNKNFSDMHAIELAKCLKSHSGHVRTISLAKNRLSDEGIGQVIRALCDTQIEYVDLQSNKLSEKSVDAIVGCLKTNKALKVLDLSNNGIGSRLMKNKLKNALPHIEIIL